MASVRVLQPGMLTTVQDLGRAGYAAQGVPGGGAADPISLRLGNRLLGNAPTAAALEMTLIGGTFTFERDTAIAITGAQCNPLLARPDLSPAPCPRMQAVPVQGGSTLTVGPARPGCRIYLCLAGGLDVPRVMGSASTCLPGAFGGLHGRAIRAGEMLATGEAPIDRVNGLFEPQHQLADELLQRRVIRAVPGAQSHAFADAGAFWASTYSVSSQSDRMGIRLRGEPILPPFHGRMPSEGMGWGFVQVPPDGMPIILMCDHPTTGGYPVIACVATVDLPILGQLAPGESLRFEMIAPDHARRLLREQEALLLQSTIDRAPFSPPRPSCEP